MILFKNAQIASEQTGPLPRADVLVEGEKIRAVGQNIEPPEGAEAQVIDCEGKILLPGLFDMHVHFRDPGRGDKETIKTGSEAAINGGVTGVLMMPNTTPAIDSGAGVQALLDNAARNARIRVLTSGCITKGQEGKDLAGIAGMKSKGVFLITDDGNPITDELVLRRAMDYAKNFELLVGTQCETPSLAGDGAMNEGAASYSLGIPGMPAISEEICLDRNLRIAQHTGAHIHIHGLSTACGMETVARFKNEGVKVSCEVAPHHLLFNEGDIGDYDTHFKTNPPLRTAEDNARLLQGLKEGIFDVIATNHAPHTQSDKNQDFTSAPFGITGLETALVSLYERFIKTGEFGWDVLVRRYSSEPRKLAKLDPVVIEEGATAEFVLFDPEGCTKFTKKFMRSKSSNTPFLDREVAGMVEMVVFNGEILLER